MVRYLFRWLLFCLSGQGPNSPAAMERTAFLAGFMSNGNNLGLWKIALTLEGMMPFLG